MYDALTGSFTFSCPTRGETAVRLSAFRQLERLPGAGHPAVYRVRFACLCGGEHDGLASHDELDWAPLGLAAGTFLNLMTSRLEPVSTELSDLAVRRIESGEWPWTFFCYPEGRPRPVFPSAFFLLHPGSRAVGVAVRCPACTAVSVNLVSPPHIDVPFHHDRSVGVLEHVFARDATGLLEDFREELYSGTFDERRLHLADGE